MNDGSTRFAGTQSGGLPFESVIVTNVGSVVIDTGSNDWPDGQRHVPADYHAPDDDGDHYAANMTGWDPIIMATMNDDTFMYTDDAFDDSLIERVYFQAGYGHNYATMVQVNTLDATNYSNPIMVNNDVYSGDANDSDSTSTNSSAPRVEPLIIMSFSCHTNGSMFISPTPIGDYIIRGINMFPYEDPILVTLLNSLINRSTEAEGNDIDYEDDSDDYYSSSSSSSSTGGDESTGMLDDSSSSSSSGDESSTGIDELSTIGGSGDNMVPSSISSMSGDATSELSSSSTANDGQ
jgi:hypothetical protein